MELMEEGDELKRELLRKSAHHREEIEGDVKLITENTEKIITNALIIGGSLALTYFLVTRLSGSSGKKSKRKAAKIKLVQNSPESDEVVKDEQTAPGMIGQLGTALVSQASIFLLNLAKEKLMEYLAEKAQKKQQD
jgi:hypothetical protein